jgi:ornithine decarboxylase
VTDEAFGAERPELVCEPGRAICGDAFTLAARVKSVRDGSHVFLNDGLYGSLFELGQIGIIDRITVLTPAGQPRKGAVHAASALVRPATRWIVCRAICPFPVTLPKATS